jgi:hypothetical protein
MSAFPGSTSTNSTGGWLFSSVPTVASTHFTNARARSIFTRSNNLMILSGKVTVIGRLSSVNFGGRPPAVFTFLIDVIEILRNNQKFERF